jgi:hypothetical protein
VSDGEEVIFCTDLTNAAEEDRRVAAYYPTVFDRSEEVVVQYHQFMHEAEVLMYPLANAVAEGKMTADEAREEFKPYREHMPWIYDPEEMEEYENGFPTTDHFMDWGSGPGISGFWEAADEGDIPGVYFNKGEHPVGHPLNSRQVAALDLAVYEVSLEGHLRPTRLSGPQIPPRRCEGVRVVSQHHGLGSEKN